MELGTILAILTEAVALASAIAAGIVSISKVAGGLRCLLRSDMLRIYYKHNDERKIRQFEYENFMELYAAYKKLHGNSFIDKVAAEIKTWAVDR